MKNRIQLLALLILVAVTALAACGGKPAETNNGVVLGPLQTIESAAEDIIDDAPGGAGAHAKEEWVDLGSVEEMAHILAQTAIHYCQ